MVEWALECGVKPASRRWGLERKTIRRWRDRWHAEGLAGLVPRYPTQRRSRLAPELGDLIEHARRGLGDGPPPVRVWAPPRTQTPRPPRSGGGFPGGGPARAPPPPVPRPPP